MADAKSVITEINEAIQADPSLAQGTEAVYEFQLDGDDGETFQLILRGEDSRAVEEAEEDSDCKMLMSADDFEMMARGKLNGTQAFMSGRLKVKGNMGLALKLQNILQAYNKQQN